VSQELIVIKMALAFIFLLTLSGLTSVVTAHEMDIAQFTFIEQEPSGYYRLLVNNLPQTSLPNQPVKLPPACILSSRLESQPGYLPSVDLEFNCRGILSGLVETQWGSDGGVLELRYLDGTVLSRMISGSRLGTSLSLPDWTRNKVNDLSLLGTAKLYLFLGAQHVLSGLDHLAFVFCLAMLASGRHLLCLITAFTIGHSLSLALSFLGVVSISIAPVETVIALSVVFMSREAILHQRAKHLNPLATSSTQSMRGRMTLTAGFGLVHGLGFASVLSDLGVQPGDTLIALTFFNIGVEGGQILFVLATIILVFACKRARVDRQAILLALNSIGAMGLFWTVQRL
jgi:hypothetical protein